MQLNLFLTMTAVQDPSSLTQLQPRLCIQYAASCDFCRRLLHHSPHPHSLTAGLDHLHSGCLCGATSATTRGTSLVPDVQLLRVALCVT